MGTVSNSIATAGITASWGWAVGGAVSGTVGAVVFGVLVWIVEPTILETAIPTIYGLEPAGVTGWTIHVAHGVGLGVIFGFLVTRWPVIFLLEDDPETDILASTGIVSRLVGAGFVFGLAVWAVLPILVLPVWMEIAGIGGNGEFPRLALESLFGHLLFGVVLGLTFAISVDLTGRMGGTR